jgi:hypothetical protein
MTGHPVTHPSVSFWRTVRLLSIVAILTLILARANCLCPDIHCSYHQLG